MQRILHSSRRLGLACLVASAASWACSGPNDPGPPEPPEEPTPPSPVGSLAVGIKTEGTQYGTTVYRVRLGGRIQSAGANATLRISSVDVGSHRVALERIPANCKVEGSNPVDVTIVEGQTAEAGFQVRCSLYEARINVETSGEDPDSNGYALQLGELQPVTVGAHGVVSRRLSGPGRYPLTLLGIARNCRLVDTSPGSILIEADIIAEVTLSVSCTARPLAGSLVVDVTTNLDGTIVIASAHGDTLRARVASSGPVVFPAVVPGTWQLTYLANSWGCQVNGTAWGSITVEIAPGTSTDLGLQVQCLLGPLMRRTNGPAPSQGLQGFTF